MADFTPYASNPVNECNVEKRLNKTSSKNQVTLENISINSTDTYECEVSSESPNFTTKTNKKKLYVIVYKSKESTLSVSQLNFDRGSIISTVRREQNLGQLMVEELRSPIKPKSGPTTESEKEFYNLGEILHANCSTQPSYPEQEIIWIVNGAPVDEIYHANETESSSEPHLLKTHSTLAFKVARLYFGREGKLTLRCVSRIMEFYEDQDVKVIKLNMTNIDISSRKHTFVIPKILIISAMTNMKYFLV
ncbi:hypothetical protein GQR58_017574 [Nymphon striatum]|nr:hypothetical protein GQR58_017574 [Nymphon striatum]